MLWAAVAELLALGAFLLVPPIAHLLEHAVPPAAGLLVALLAVPGVLGADLAHKTVRAHRRDHS